MNLIKFCDILKEKDKEVIILGFYEDIIEDRAIGIANLLSIGLQLENNYLFQLGCDEVEKLGTKESNKTLYDVTVNRLILEYIDVFLEDDDNITEDAYDAIYDYFLVSVYNLDEFGSKYEEDLHIKDKNFFKAIDTLFDKSQSPDITLDLTEEVTDDVKQFLEESLVESNKALDAIGNLMDSLDEVAEDTEEYNKRLTWFCISVNYLLRKHSCITNVLE